MMKTIKSDNKVVTDSKNYAAIYARTSSKVENNSIEAQISISKSVLNSKNLLLYAVYVDTVSGYSTPPPDRDGFGKLLEDAKAGCFKTLVAYKHDRIARNLNDWVNLKNQLRKLKIKIIFSDDTEYASDNSVQGEFLENLVVMVGELEPNNINERTSAGKLEMRKKGVYSSGNNIPFGYKRNPIPDAKTPGRDNSFYAIDPLAAIFVQHLFCEAKGVLGKKGIKVENIKRNMQGYIADFLKSTSSEALSESLISFAYSTKARLVKSHEKEVFLNEITRILESHLKEKTLEQIQTELIKIEDSLSKPGNINSLLRNSTYGCHMLLNIKEDSEGEEKKEQGVIIKDNIPSLKEDAFVTLINVAPIIDKDTFSKVYSYIRMPSILKENEPNFLFKGKLKCGNCKKLLHATNSLLTCKKGCKTYAKNSVIEAALDIIIDDAFKISKNGFYSFCDTIDKKLDYLRKDLQRLRDAKVLLLQAYLSDKDNKYVKFVQDNQDDTNILLNKIATYANELSYINKLQQVIELYNKSIPESKKSNSDISRIKSSIITYVLSNQDIFSLIFNKLINEIKVITIEQKCKIKCKFTVNYEFNYEKPSNIPTRID